MVYKDSIAQIQKDGLNLDVCALFMYCYLLVPTYRWYLEKS